MNGGEARKGAALVTVLGSLQAALGQVREAVLIASATGTPLWCNASFARMTRISTNELTQSEHVRRQWNAVFDAARDALAHGQTWRGNTRLGDPAVDIDTHVTPFAAEPPLLVATFATNDCAHRPCALTEAAEREVFSHYGSLFQFSNDPIFIIDTRTDGEFIVEDVNPAYERVIGLSAHEVVGRPIRDILPPEQAAVVLARYRQCVETHAPLLYEEELEICGRPCISLTNLRPVEDSQGRVVRLMGIVRDLSENRRLDAELSRRERQLRMIAEAGTDGFWEFHLPERQIEVTGVLATLLGYEDREMPRTPEGFAKLLHPGDRETSRAAFSAHVLGDSPYYRTDLRIRHKNGAWRWFAVRGRLLERHENGTPALVAGTYRDVTERMESLMALRESEERYRSVVSVIAEGVVLRAPDGTVLACNEAACDILGVPQEELLGSKSYYFDMPCIMEDGTPVPPEQRPSMVALSTGLPVHNAVLGLERGEDDLRWLRAHAIPLRRPGEDKPYAAVSTFSDITETRATMQALERARIAAEAATKARTEFLAAMSHEIRTPMNGVLGMCQLLLDSELTKEQREQADAILESARSLLALINDILDLSRIDATQFSPERVSFDIAALLTHVVTMLGNEARSKGLDFRLEYASDMPIWFEGDPGRFRQVVVNLVSNAIRYTDTGSVVLRASWEKQTHMVRIDVADTGIGIAQEQMPTIFERFGVVNETSRRRAGGTGLGLSIAKSIAENLQGRIEVASEPGVGSTFSFVLPMSPVEDQNPAPDAHASDHMEPPSIEGATVLLVEDNLINQRVATALLKRVGCRVDIAGDGADGVAKALAGNYDAILMDCMMPVMDGFEATRAIRAAQIRRRTPIIALTASVMEDERRRCIAAGMDAILGKPVEAKALADTLALWVRRARRPRHRSVRPPDEAR